jgi:hypothetical protein
MRAAKHASRVPGAAQHEVMRCRPGTVTRRTLGDPGSAVHRFALHRIRDTLAMPIELNQKGNRCR